MTEEYGIYPLGTWDSQASWVSQLNVWEAKGAPKAPEGYQKGCGTVLCIGNGGCEFSMKNEDGTPDKSAAPKNNSCQENILKLAKNRRISAVDLTSLLRNLKNRSLHVDLMQ